MILVWANCEHIEVNMLNIHIDIPISHSFVHISDGVNHVNAFVGRIDHLRPWLILLDVLSILNSHNQAVTQGFGVLKKENMPDMEHIIYAKS